MMLSLTHKQWSLRSPEHAEGSPQVILARLLNERGIRPSATEKLTSPDAFPDMARAKERILKGIAERERIGIFGDYDCDGITATALLTRAFHRRGIEPTIRLPHRIRDGYGLNTEIVRSFADVGVTLLITVDTGITAVEEIALAAEHGIDVIVTDHHHLRDELPPAYALLHPLLAPAYPAPHPSGAGVALCLVRALEGDRWDDMHTDIALAAIGTVADLVPLCGDNRTLVQAGIRSLNTLQKGPLVALAEQAGLSGRGITSSDIAFRIAPRLNAAGRMADPHIALRALLEGGEAVATLERLNAERQQETETLFQGLLRDLAFDLSAPLPADPPFLSAASTEYPHGIIGLLAGRLTELSGKPSMVATIDGETCTASLRSPSAYNITAGLERCKDLLLRFGGHAQAAGCTFTTQNIDALNTALTEDVRAHTDPATLVPSVGIDAHLHCADITLAFCEKLELLEPYGMGNPEPRFLLHGVRLDSARRVGMDGKHLQTRVGGIKAIGFGLGNLLPHTYLPLDIVCRLGIDTWQGNRAPQIFVEDMRVSVAAEKTLDPVKDSA